MSEIRKLNKLNANAVLAIMTLDEVPEGYRDEVWIEEENGEVIDNWFVGSEGAVSYSGRTLTTEDWFQ